MVRKYHLIFNNQSTLDLGLSIVSRPGLMTAERNYNEITIPGRDGTLTEEKELKNINISIEFNCVCREGLQEFNRRINDWLLCVQDNKLIFSDNTDFYYKVKRVIVEEKAVKKKVVLK